MQPDNHIYGATYEKYNPGCTRTPVANASVSCARTTEDDRCTIIAPQSQLRRCMNQRTELTVYAFNKSSMLLTSLVLHGPIAVVLMLALCLDCPVCSLPDIATFLSSSVPIMQGWRASTLVTVLDNELNVVYLTLSVLSVLSCCVVFYFYATSKALRYVQAAVLIPLAAC